MYWTEIRIYDIIIVTNNARSEKMKRSPVEVWIWLLLVLGPNIAKYKKLFEHFDSAESLARSIRDGNCPGLTNDIKYRAKNTHTREVRLIIEECRKNDIRIVTLDDNEYPSLLKNIYSPPIVLFVRGTLKCLENEVSLSVVGPRQPSQYAVRVARSICSDLAKLGTVLISGLAVGIDTVAHTCALNEGAPTVGVLACGQLVNYPAESGEMKRRIIESGGAIISELLPHDGVEPSYFRERNRMISGLALGTLVVEASSRSGCLLTANHAIEQGRDLFCIPPTDITKDFCAGVIPFLRDGAIPVFDYIDIVHEYMYNYFSKIDPELLKGRLRKDPPKKNFNAARPAPRTDNRSDARPETAPAPQKQSPEPQSAAPPENNKLSADKLEGLNEFQTRLVKLVEKEPYTADNLIAITEVTYPEAIEALTDLELADIIELQADGRYHIK